MENDKEIAPKEIVKEKEIKSPKQAERKKHFPDPKQRDDYFLKLFFELMKWNFVGSDEEFFSRLNEITKCQVIGFDIDFTLAFYKKKYLLDLISKGFAQFLVNNCGWPKDELFDKDFQELVEQFASIDIIIDYKKGNCIKINENWRIIKAYHGLNEMKDEEIIKSYGNEKQIQPFEFPSLNKELGYQYLSDLFTTCYIYLFLKGVNIFEKRAVIVKGGNENLTPEEIENIAGKVYKELSGSPEALFGMKNLLDTLKNSGSSYYTEIEQHPENYLYLNYKEKIVNLLKYLKYDLGKNLFFSTNSQYYYAKFIVEQAIGTDFIDLFDLCFYKSGKPLFWDPEKPGKISKVNEKTNIQEEIPKLTDELFNKITKDKEKIFVGGNFNFIMEFYDKLFGQVGGRNYLYIGDNIKSDCAVVRKISMYGWRTLFLLDKIQLSGFEEQLGESDENYGKKWKERKNFKNNNEENGMSILFKNNNVDFALPNVFGLEYIIGSNLTIMQKKMQRRPRENNLI